MTTPSGEHVKTFVTQRPEDTETLGYILAGLMPPRLVVALRGELAAGKTCFVRGIAQRFGCADAVSSPTFTLVNQYGQSPRIYHVDLYRLASATELVDLGYEDLFDPDGICLVEWAERAGDWLPERRLDIAFVHMDDACRRIVIENRDALPIGWQALIESQLQQTT
jgi:tRNA threonylcarbamoyladenosine biosynthesis protein TsaE